MKKLGVLLLLGVALLIAWIKRDAIQMAMFTRAVEGNMARNALGGLDPKALHVGFCGTGSPVPSADRGEACTVVIAGGRLFVFDAGEGAGRTLSLMGMPLAKTEGVWLTHLHSDHFEGLGNLAIQRWAGTSAAPPLSVSGPEGVAEVVGGLNTAYRLDGTYRMAHHGPAALPPGGFGMTATTIAPGIVYDKGGVKITAFLVDHRPVAPAYGYRLDFGARSVTLSGDTAPTPTLIAAAKGSDLLVNEVISPRMVSIIRDTAAKAGQPGRAKIMNDILSYHTTPESAADMARAAGVKTLAFTHVVPAVPRFMQGAFMGAADEHFGGKIILARDGDLLSIGADGKAKRTSLLR